MTSKAQNAKQAGEKTPGHQVESTTSQELAVQEVPFSLSVQRAVRDLPAASVREVQALQSGYGNRAVLGLLRGTSARPPAVRAPSRSVIQAKLRVGPANDTYEREADRMADRVMNMSIAEAAPVQLAGPEDDDLPEAESIQRFDDEDILTVEPLASPATPILQAKADDGFEVGSSVESRLTASKGGGAPLPAQTRAFMEPRFGADFSGVRVHTDSGAVQMNHELNAQAFTHGRDIYMGANKYNPGSSAGNRLLAHELTHVVQQGGAGALQRQGVAGTVQREDVEFPSYSDIVADDKVKSETAKAWTETKEASDDDGRREQSFWIQWNSETKAYSITQREEGDKVDNKPPKGAKVKPGATPADSGKKYTVACFHTHTPTFHWTAGYERKVGPSGQDGPFHDGRKMPGVVYDYKEKADGKIPSGHPLNSAAKLWSCGPNKRT